MRDGLARRAAHTTSALAAAPVVPVLAALCAIQIGIALWFALETPHNGWVWYSGGDATEYWAGEWNVGHLFLPQTLIGWGLPVFYAWIPLVSGITLLHGLPIVVVLQVGILVPLIVVLFFLVADRLFGRVYAWFATALWIVTPLLLVWGFRDHTFRLAFEQEFAAPHLYGLTNMADLPALAATLATVWAALRAVDSGSDREALLAGLLGGVLLGLKPGNSFLFVALAVLFVAVRQWRTAAVFGAGLAPAIVTLAVWKERGLGHLPLFALGRRREALGGGGVPVASIHPGRYVPWSMSHFQDELHDMAQLFWSVRLLEWIAIAGCVAMIRRSPSRGAFVTVWLFLFLVVKGSTSQASVSTTSYFRLTEPGLPALVLGAAALPFLLPGMTARVSAPVRRAPVAAVAAVAVVAALLPLVLVAALRNPTTFRTARNVYRGSEFPISNSLAATVHGRRLRWHAPSIPHGRVHYSILRLTGGDAGGCGEDVPGGHECLLYSDVLTATYGTSIRVPRGSSYRIGAAANYRGVPSGQDLILVGPPVRVP